MRTGTCTVQQALTAEAASVLKHSLSLARRRGHAQVTPLHVAATLLTSSSISSSNLLRRACLKSHPHHPASHPLQCRALELCFNVALNRLPTTPPPSSGSLIHPHPSLSNALIAALKRAQAHQRRGCIEQQQVQPQAHHLQNQQQQQQPLLALKVELEQLIISILDDPSVSRVMREAGFSSTSVKSNIEEDCTSPPRPPPQSSSFFFDPHRDFITHFLNPPPPQTNPGLKSFPEEDLKVVMEVMLRKQGKRSNTVVVGDSVTMTEGLVAELKRMVENGEVPDELKSAHFISLHLSYIHLRLMSRCDVEMKLSDVKAKMCSLERGGGGIIIDAGDLRWAVDEQTGGSGFRPVDHMVSELGKLLFEMKSTNESGRVWLLATASYQTYMKCQMKQPSLESQWSLQAVVVPSGGLALSLQSPSGLDSRVPKLSQYPFQMLEPKAFSLKDGEDKLSCCAECTSSYEKEASVLLQSDPKANSSSSSHLPYWLQPHKTDNHHKDAALVELRRKWNRLCRNLRHVNQIHLYPPLLNQSLIGKNYMYTPSSHPWWGSTSLSCNQAKIFGGTRSISLPNSPPRANPESPDCIAQLQTTEKEAKLPWLSESSLNTLKRSLTMDVRTTLALGSPLFSDSATSKDQRECFRAKKQELTQRLQENIPWQSEAIPSIVEALLNCRPAEKKGTWLLIQGNDHIGKRRLARSISEANRFNLVKASRASLFANTFAEALKKDPRCVFLIEGIDENFMEALKDSYSGKEANLAHCIFILSTSNSTEEQCSVLNMRLLVEEISPPPDASMIKDRKRKPELRSSHDVSKKSRSKDIDIDLNVCVEDGYEGEEEEEEEEEDAVPSDLTQESDGSELNLPQDILESIDASFTLHTSPQQSSQITRGIESKLRVAFEEACGGDRRLRIDPEVAEAMGSLPESEVERWVKEVFQATVGRKGGKVVRLSVEGRMGNVMDCGFMGSVLPNRIHLGD